MAGLETGIDFIMNRLFIDNWMGGNMIMHLAVIVASMAMVTRKTSDWMSLALPITVGWWIFGMNPHMFIWYTVIVIFGLDNGATQLVSSFVGTIGSGLKAAGRSIASVSPGRMRDRRIGKMQKDLKEYKTLQKLEKEEKRMKDFYESRKTEKEEIKRGDEFAREFTGVPIQLSQTESQIANVEARRAIANLRPKPYEPTRRLKYGTKKRKKKAGIHKYTLRELQEWIHGKEDEE